MKIRSVCLFLALCLAAFPGYAQQVAPRNFKNPIIPGFHPDPSICRVGDDYYLVNSSFEWFPGVPIFHSRDLVNWEPLGYVLDRPSQLTFKKNMKWSAGIWAPTIRYNNGVFYVIVTCKQCQKDDPSASDNLLVTATNPAGPWSDPIWIKDAPGIDPSLYFEDGKAYYAGGGATDRSNPGWEEKYPGNHHVYIQEVDLKTGESLSKKVLLTSGHAIDAKYAEGPHIYKIGKKYVLLVSEGGTWQNHAVTAFDADSIFGPYTALQANPVLSHRQLGNGADISAIGHADLVQTQNGEWWSVLLGVRDGNGFNQLGRETFLTPVRWEGSNPVFNPGIGRVLIEQKRPDLPWSPFVKKPSRDDFDGERLDFQWNFLRNPLTKWYRLTNGNLEIELRPEKSSELVNPSLIARRIEHHDFSATTMLTFSSALKNEQAGIIALQNDSNQYRLMLGSGKLTLYKICKKQNVRDQIIAEVDYMGKTVVLGIKAKELKLQFYYGKDEESLEPFGDLQDASILSSTVAGGFIGPFVGMYATSSGMGSINVAKFGWFEYRELEP